MRKRYVAGFMFDDVGNVAVVKKQTPKWQKDKLNGIGGKVEPHENNPIEAMVREFQEETGFETDERDWRLFCTLQGNDGEEFEVSFYSSTHWPIMPLLRTMTREEILVVPINYITLENALPNLQWLIPMAKSMVKESVQSFVVTEVSK